MFQYLGPLPEKLQVQCLSFPVDTQTCFMAPVLFWISFPFCCLASWRRADKRHWTGHLRVAGYFLGRYAEGTGAHVRGILSCIPHHCCSGGTRASCPASWLVLYIICTHRHIHVCIFIWGYWYFSLQSWFQLVLHPAQHFSWCTLHRS